MCVSVGYMCTCVQACIPHIQVEQQPQFGFLVDAHKERVELIYEMIEVWTEMPDFKYLQGKVKCLEHTFRNWFSPSTT